MPEIPPSPLLELQRLFESLFTAGELVRFLHLRLGPHGGQLRASLPEGGSLAELTYAAIVALDRRGLIDGALFDALVAERAQRGEQIRAVQRAGDWGGGPRPVRSATPSRDLVDKLERAAEVLREFVVYYTSDNAGRWGNLYRLQGEFLFLRSAVRSLASGGLSREVVDNLAEVMDTARNTRSILTELEEGPRARLLASLELSIAYIRACVAELRAADAALTAG